MYPRKNRGDIQLFIIRRIQDYQDEGNANEQLFTSSLSPFFTRPLVFFLPSFFTYVLPSFLPPVFHLIVFFVATESLKF